MMGPTMDENEIQNPMVHRSLCAYCGMQTTITTVGIVAAKNFWSECDECGSRIEWVFLSPEMVKAEDDAAFEKMRRTEPRYSEEDLDAAGLTQEQIAAIRGHGTADG